MACAEVVGVGEPQYPGTQLPKAVRGSQGARARLLLLQVHTSPCGSGQVQEQGDERTTRGSPEQAGILPRATRANCGVPLAVVSAAGPDPAMVGASSWLCCAQGSLPPGVPGLEPGSDGLQASARRAVSGLGSPSSTCVGRGRGKPRGRPQEQPGRRLESDRPGSQVAGGRRPRRAPGSKHQRRRRAGSRHHAAQDLETQAGD